jgi:hypothetical protein
MAVEYAMFMKRYVRHKITSSPNFEVFFAESLWALVLSNLVMRSDFVQIEASRQHLKIEVQSIKMDISVQDYYPEWTEFNFCSRKYYMIDIMVCAAKMNGLHSGHIKTLYTLIDYLESPHG